MNHLVLPQQPQGQQISRSGLTFDINQTKMWFVRPDPRKRYTLEQVGEFFGVSYAIVGHVVKKMESGGF